VRFQLLGPLRVDVDGEPVGLGGTKQRMVLAHLLLNAGKPVRAAQLVDVLWGAEPPTSAAANLQTYVWRLRRTLPFDGLVTSGTGYELRTPPETVDAWLFRDAYARARAERDPVVALAALREAEGLWQGDPLADLPTVPAWEAELSGLSEARLAATEDRLALQVRLGDHGPVIEELAGLLAEHPYRERLWQQYLLALAGAGRRADALAAYADVRGRFVANLGVEPGPALRDAHAAVLRDETPVETPATAAHQLPADLPDFVGRAVTVVGLVSALAPRPGTFAAPVAVVSGPPGTGKSVLALHVAHRLRDDYPDGQFYADLDATGDRPRDPADVLADFLHALGVFGAGLPDGATARAALFRSRLAGRRVLVVLDDAAGAAQVRPLLPADGGCAVLVTARSRLPGLTGVHDVDLKVFGAQDSTRLLAAVAGAGRVATEPAHAADIVEFCGHLPLAIRIAGTRLAGRRAWSLRTLRDRLADESTRLRELRAGDLAVRQSFELSVRQLSDAGVRAFGRLALLGGREFPAWAVDALLGEPAHDVLDTLVDANLVALAGPDRGGHPQYALHSLLHIHARDIVAAEPADERAAAFRRAMSALLSLVKRAAAGLPAAFGAITGEPLGWTLDEEVERAVVADPLAWFAAQRGMLARAVELTAAAGEAALAWQLAAAAVPFQDLRGHYDDWRAGHEHALDAVRTAGDRAGEAAMLRGLGQVHLYRDEYGDARRAFVRSAELFAEVGDPRGEAFAVGGLGTVARVADRPEEALPHYLRALELLRLVGDRSGEAQMLGSLGTVCHVLGQPSDAADRLSAALAVAVEIGDRHREAKVRTELGAVHRGTGDFGAAERELTAALGILEGLRDERCTAYALLGIGETLLATGAAARARGMGERALDVFRQTGNRGGETQALLLLAHCRRARVP
jgi:DNA-binding SARP family transcriptional activator/tetratricopeptide (TPR) repeat protein